MSNVVIIMMVITLGLVGCASTRPNDFHKIAILDDLTESDQANLTLPFDAYVVGVEKDNSSRVGKVKECVAGEPINACLNIDADYYTSRPELQENLRAKYYDQFRPTFLSHIVRFSPNGPPCAIFNIYVGTRYCDDAASSRPTASVAASWDALALLQSNMDAVMRAKRPTHVLIYTMGWNTDQSEAINNFRELVSNLQNAALRAGSDSATFRPLVIGITWPSTGKPTISNTDYGIKAKDADEVGAVWINSIINRELRPLKLRYGFKVVVIGHSFGARATSRAAFSWPLVTGEMGTPTVDLLLSLQGAYSYQRYASVQRTDDPDGGEQAPYRDFSRGAGTVVLTASSFDTAVTAAGHAPFFVGSMEAYIRSKSASQSALFTHTIAEPDGDITNIECGPSRVLYVDASTIIKNNKPGTGGGAHSGIYNAEIGNMTFRLIQRCSP